MKTWSEITFKRVCTHETTRLELGRDERRIVCVKCGTVVLRRSC